MPDAGSYESQANADAVAPTPLGGSASPYAARIIERLEPNAARTFQVRWDRYSPDLIASLRRVYGERADALVDHLLDLMLDACAERPDDLKLLDEQRVLRPDWLQDPSMVGYVCYADRFAGTLAGVGEKRQYLVDLGVTALHLMPLLQPREGESDGGYAVQDYRSVRADLGTMDDLAALTKLLRNDGISLELDFVLNHVAKEHEWAARARAGEQKYRDYFYVYPDRTIPDQFERTLPEVFPDFAPGNFTFDDELNGWVWTTFNSFQWDLNWSNPDVFAEMADVILYLANNGVEIFRLDAIAFIWKVMGTDCQNEPPVHDLTVALRSMARVVAPAVAFKAEAIVSPEDLIAYLGHGRHYAKVSDLAYHNSLMVQLWSTLATRDARLMQIALNRIPAKPTTTTWGTYARCHDDIGWAISDVDAAAAMSDGFNHRKFLSDFYAGIYPGTFARGLVFQENPVTQDRRISGSLASLAGLESATESGNWFQVLDATHRIELLHAVILGFGGLPLIYMGDEIAMLNDYSYVDHPDHANDNRWVHRPKMDWDAVADLAVHDATPAAWVHAGVQHHIAVRKRTPHLHASVESRVVESPDRRILMLRRDHPLGTMIQVYNFSEDRIDIPMAALRDHLGDQAEELLGGHSWDLRPDWVRVDKYQSLWFVAPVAE